METIVEESEGSVSPTGSFGIASRNVVAVERGVIYRWSYLTWSGDFYTLKVLEGSGLERYKSLAQSGGGHDVIVRKVSESGLKSEFREIIIDMIEDGAVNDIDIEAVKKIFSNSEIRTYFPVLARMIPSAEIEYVEESNKNLLNYLYQGLTKSDLTLALADFNRARSFARQALILVQPPQKILMKSLTSLIEGLIAFCQGMIEKERVYFEEVAHKLDEAVDVIPAAQFPLKIISKSLSRENPEERREGIAKGKKLAIQILSKEHTRLEDYIIRFFIKFTEDA